MPSQSTPLWTTLWPPYAVRITEGDLDLTVVRDEDLPDLVALVQGGVHDPSTMPFLVPWTDEDPQTLPASLVRYYSRTRADFGPDKFDLLFAVRVGGDLAGVQALHTEHFPVTRTAETGSWLGQSWHGRGVGTRMRRAVCAFAFDELGAVEITSGAFLDNPASLAVSTKVGYRPNGRVRLRRREGGVAINQRLVLIPEDFVRGDPIEVQGAEELRRFLGLT
jgi:RimJ/RimL family protein N-acetyltransferase